MQISKLKLSIVIPTLLLTCFLNGCGSSSDSTSDNETVNTAPTANAGIDLTATVLIETTLDGSLSSDPENDQLTYLWSLTSKPSDSDATLINVTSVNPSFTPDISGEYLVSLIVNDGSLDSNTDTITVYSDVDSQTYSYPIVDTNQTSCYSSTTGDTIACSGVGTDADYSGNQPSYALSEDGLIVTDNNTGLTWTQSTDINNDGVVDYDDKLYQSEADSYCDALSISGEDNWRLPNIKEAYSLILFSGKDASSYQGSDTSTLVLFLDDVFDRAFGDLNSVKDRIIDGQYASTTIYVDTTMNGQSTMFGVNYVDGRIKGYPTNTKEYYVRCVTGNEAYGVNDFSDNNDLTVSDNATGLMWQQNDNKLGNWDDAINQCEISDLADYSDWRLPNIKELQSILDYSRSPATSDSAAIDPVFNASSFTNEEGEKDWHYYWASTTHVDNDDDGSNATYASFGRALGYMSDEIMDVHGAGSQRSNDKLDVSKEPGASLITVGDSSFYYKGPQGDILRDSNMSRCVRDIL